MKPFLIGLILAFSISALHAQTTVQEWQAKAVSKYPQLGVQGSEINKKFVEAYTQRTKTNPEFFTNPRWPLDLADELAAVRPQPDAKLPRPFIGSTEAEALARYGEPVKQVDNPPDDPPADKVLTFEKDGIYIITFFYRGHAGNVTYTRKDKRSFLQEEAQVLIQNNSNGSRWIFRDDIPQNQNWESADGSMMAINHTDFSGLVIVTREYLNAMKKASANSLRGL
jgi:hypothetical protein